MPDLLIIAEDPLARAALASSFAEEEEWFIETADWSELSQAESPDVDAILIDLGWQDASELPESLKWDVPIAILASTQEGAEVALGKNVRGVLGRDLSPSTLTAALSAILQNLQITDPSLITLTKPKSTDSVTELSEVSDPLTDRETEVLNQLALGKTNKAIGLALEISDHTVKFHINAILTKLNAQSRTEAAVRAQQLGILSI